MISNEKNVPKKSKKTSSSIFLYVAGSIVAIIAVALLINNIVLFYTNLNRYVAEGYEVAEVMKQLLPVQLLPGLFEPIAVYGGISILLFSAGFINEKVSKSLALLTDKTETITEIIKVTPLNQEETLAEDHEALDKIK